MSLTENLPGSLSPLTHSLTQNRSHFQSKSFVEALLCARSCLSPSEVPREGDRSEPGTCGCLLSLARQCPCSSWHTVGAQEDAVTMPYEVNGGPRLREGKCENNPGNLAHLGYNHSHLSPELLLCAQCCARCLPFILLQDGGKGCPLSKC